MGDVWLVLASMATSPQMYEFKRTNTNIHTYTQRNKKSCVFCLFVD